MGLSLNTFEIQVGIGEYKVCMEPGQLITIGLGSCVGVSLYDQNTRTGGLLHLMLPDSSQFSNVTKPAKFADSGIPLLIFEMQKRGAFSKRLQAKLVGGAQMFSGRDDSVILNIGHRNVEKARAVLKDFGIKVIAEDVGGNKGRTMILDTTNGQVTIRMVGSNLRVI